jgi:hypothetical protein
MIYLGRDGGKGRRPSLAIAKLLLLLLLLAMIDDRRRKISSEYLGLVGWAAVRRDNQLLYIYSS